MSTIELGWFDPAFGGNTSYGNFDSRFYFNAPIGGEKLFSGYRLNVVSRWGNPTSKSAITKIPLP